jgi:hypothetical protein
VGTRASSATRQLIKVAEAAAPADAAAAAPRPTLWVEDARTRRLSQLDPDAPVLLGPAARAARIADGGQPPPARHQLLIHTGSGGGTAAALLPSAALLSPEEVQAHALDVVACLNVLCDDDLVALSQTCRHYHALVREHPLLWLRRPVADFLRSPTHAHGGGGASSSPPPSPSYAQAPLPPLPPEALGRAAFDLAHHIGVMRDVFARLQLWTLSTAFDYELPAPPVNVRSLEHTLGYRLPPWLKAALCVHNGQPDTASHGAHVDGLRLLPANEIAAATAAVRPDVAAALADAGAGRGGPHGVARCVVVARAPRGFGPAMYLFVDCDDDAVYRARPLSAARVAPSLRAYLQQAMA